MLKNQYLKCVTFALVCIVLLAPRRSETRATKGREESGDSPGEKYTVVAESIMTNTHDWLQWRKQFFLSFFCFSLLFVLYFFPKATQTVEFCVCYNLENPTVNLCALKPASVFFMNLQHSKTAS